VIVVDRPGSVQSMLMVGHDGPPRKVDDYVAMTTMSLVLGGMFSSRLNLKLREEKGYAYGAFGGFDTRRHGGLFLTRAAVQSDVTIPALTDLVAEIERMHTGGVEPAELEQARAYRAGVFPINFAGVMSVASGLGDLVINDFADDHFDALRARVLDVRKEELDTSAAIRLHPDDLVTVVVGDASGFATELESAGLGPVTIVPDEQ
jgi:predicted Zn-dependent peptidase